MKKGYSSASSHTVSAPKMGKGRPVNWTQGSPGVSEDGYPMVNESKSANIVTSRMNSKDAGKR